MVTVRDVMHLHSDWWPRDKGSAAAMLRKPGAVTVHRGTAAHFQPEASHGSTVTIPAPGPSSDRPCASPQSARCATVTVGTETPCCRRGSSMASAYSAGTSESAATLEPAPEPNRCASTSLARLRIASRGDTRWPPGPLHPSGTAVPPPAAASVSVSPRAAGAAPGFLRALRWHRELLACQARGSRRRPCGRAACCESRPPPARRRLGGWGQISSRSLGVPCELLILRAKITTAEAAAARLRATFKSSPRCSAAAEAPPSLSLTLSHTHRYPPPSSFRVVASELRKAGPDLWARSAAAFCRAWVAAGHEDRALERESWLRLLCIAYSQSVRLSLAFFSFQSHINTSNCLPIFTS